MRVARNIGGRGEPAKSIKVYRCGKAYEGDGGMKYKKQGSTYYPNLLHMKWLSFWHLGLLGLRTA
jgi:hypothetical protein